MPLEFLHRHNEKDEDNNELTRSPYKLALIARLELKEYFPDYTVGVESIKLRMTNKLKLKYETQKAKGCPKGYVPPLRPRTTGRRKIVNKWAANPDTLR